MPSTAESCQLLVQSLMDESPKVRGAAAQQLILHFPSIADLSLSQRCSVIQAATETPCPALNDAIGSWFSSCGNIADLQWQDLPCTSQNSHGVPKSVEASQACPNDADLQAVAKAMVLLGHIGPVENEGEPWTRAQCSKNVDTNRPFVPSRVWSAAAVPCHSHKGGDTARA